MGRIVLSIVMFSVTVAAFAAFVIQHDYSPVDRVPIRPGVSNDISDIRDWRTTQLTEALAPLGAQVSSPVYLRVFKEEAELELWVKTDDTYSLFKTYPICRYSGDLGPKLREGDHQSPEGFYRVGLGSLNPNSSYHLSFNLGFPNAFDRAHERTGSFLMIHGDCLSVGCYAMTDPAIEEIYVLVEAALRAGQGHVDVHAFPFRMTDQRMARAETHKWYGFWEQLRPAYDAFNETQQVPVTKPQGQRYAVTKVGDSG